jgi:hypothetical protein
MFPNEEWRRDTYILASSPNKKTHVHQLIEFSPWIPRMKFGRYPHHDGGRNDEKQWMVLVEKKDEKDAPNPRTEWEIVPAPTI